ncbi:hypothetical protein RYX36_014642 [Vicia faba]
MEKMIEKIRAAPRGAKVVASILAIVTTNPPNFILETDYPNFYFKDRKRKRKRNGSITKTIRDMTDNASSEDSIERKTQR